MLDVWQIFRKWTDLTFSYPSFSEAPSRAGGIGGAPSPGNDRLDYPSVVVEDQSDSPSDVPR